MCHYQSFLVDDRTTDKLEIEFLVWPWNDLDVRNEIDVDILLTYMNDCYYCIHYLVQTNLPVVFWYVFIHHIVKKYYHS